MYEGNASTNRVLDTSVEDLIVEHEDMLKALDFTPLRATNRPDRYIKVHRDYVYAFVRISDTELFQYIGRNPLIVK